MKPASRCTRSVHRQAELGDPIDYLSLDEVARWLAALPTRCTLSHYRGRQGREIDLILEASDGHLAAVEVKATTSPALEHLDNLRWLRDRLDGADPGAFRTGILLHTGAHSATLDDRLHLRPVNTLWSGQCGKLSWRTPIR